MRHESSMTSLTWIPSEAIQGMTRLPFDIGVTRYDEPPPDRIEDLDQLVSSGAVRFANVLKGWVEVADGKIVDYGQEGQGYIGMSKARLGPKQFLFPAIAFPDLHPEPEVGDDYVRFVQTGGGKAPFPAPRRVRHRPFIKIEGPTAWTTLALTIKADGSSTYEVSGASQFPRHWIYDDDGKLIGKTGTIDFKTWYREAFGGHTPWGDEDSPALVTEIETALEREMSQTLMGGAKPKFKKVKSGQTLVEQGEEGDKMFLLLDGVLVVEVDGEPLAEVGPGAILGERAILEGGKRTSTLRATTPCRVAVASGDEIDRDALVNLSEGHRREERGASTP